MVLAEIMSNGRAPILSGSLVLSAALNGSTVWYTIQLSDGTEVRTARFSELYDLHQRLIAEVPSFPGRLPSKTLKRNMSADFIESRRGDIETYLRLVATHGEASQSIALQAFVGNHSLTDQFVPTSSNNGSEMQQDSVATSFTNATSYTNDDYLYDSINSDMKETISKAKSELTAAHKAKQDLEACLCPVEEEVDTTAPDRAAFEAKSALCLHDHLLSLERLDAKLAADNDWRSEEERRLNELAKCFQEKLPLVADSVKKAEERLETSRQAKREGVAKSKSKVAAALAEQVAAETANEAATERHAAIAAAIGMLEERAKAHVEDLKAAEREVDILRLAQQALATERSEAESLRDAAEAAVDAAAADEASHISEAANGSRARKVDVLRAKEFSSGLAKLRDLKTRGSLTEDDRSSCKHVESSAIAAADTAAEAVAQLKRLHEEAQAADAQKSSALRAATSKAQKHLTFRNNLIGVLADRMKDVKGKLHRASTKCAKVGAAIRVVQEERENLKFRMRLAGVLPTCAERVREAEKTTMAAKLEGEQEQASFRIAIQAESQLLQKHKAEEALLVQELETAQMAAAEAHEGIALRSEERFLSMMETDGDRIKIDELVQLSDEQCADRDREMKEATDVYAIAKATAEAAHRRSMWPSGLKDRELCESLAMWTTNVKSCPLHLNWRNIVAPRRLQSGIKEAITEYNYNNWQVNWYLKKVVQKQKVLSDRVAALVSVGSEERAALQAQQRATPVPSWYTRKLVRDELAIISAALQDHKDNESIILSEFEQKKADWVRKQAALAADLRHAELEVSVAEQNVQATQDWCRVRV